MLRNIELIGDKDPLPDRIHEHSSMLLIRDLDNPERIIMSQYDETYHKIDYRLRVNLIGGAEEQEDKNPRYTLERELNEEINYKEGTNFAPKEFIQELREEVIKSVFYHGTFQSFFLGYEGGPRRNYASIDTAFISDISNESFSSLEDFLSKGLKIVTEGNITSLNLDEIKKRTKLTAWDSGKIISDIYNTEIPNPDNVFCVKLNIEELKDYQTLRNFFSFR